MPKEGGANGSRATTLECRWRDQRRTPRVFAYFRAYVGYGNQLGPMRRL